MIRLLLPLSLLSCVVVGNDRPYIAWAEASCAYDARYGDWVWIFDAEVLDSEGPVRFVDVHVYDDWSGTWADSFPLDPTRDPYVWTSAWTQFSTRLYCGDPYIIDFVAEDHFRAKDVYTVRMGGWW